MRFTKKGKTEFSSIAIISIARVGHKPARAILPAFIHLITIFTHLGMKVTLIAENIAQDEIPGPNVTIHSVNRPLSGRLFAQRLVGYLIYQIKLSLKLIKLSKDIDINFFLMGGSLFPIPIIVSHIMGIKNVIRVIGSPSKGCHLDHPIKLGNVLCFSIRATERLTFSLAHRIIVLSKATIDFEQLQKYGEKISMANFNYIDTESFKSCKSVQNRPEVVAFVGRIGIANGAINFARAILYVFSEKKDVSFLIIGDGSELERVKHELRISGLKDKVMFTGWVPHEELPKYLNDIKLYVLPSYSEGLPKATLEAMACGTPVLVTPVGGIPDVIKDGKTGFITEDNSSECIARNIIRALSHPNLGQISQNGAALIEKEYGYDVLRASYESIIARLSL